MGCRNIVAKMSGKNALVLQQDINITWVERINRLWNFVLERKETER
jgi:hypothetical protein